MIAGAGQGKHFMLDVWGGAVTSETSTPPSSHQPEKKRGAKIWQKWKVESDKVSGSCLSYQA